MQSGSPLITTVIPTYRRPRLLRRAIQSVLSQTYPHLQVLVLDNASGDETEMVVAELARQDPRVRYHRHPENIGSGPNFIYGMEHVATPYFSFLSDDDVLLPSFYQTAMTQLAAHPEAAFFAGEVIGMTDGGQIRAVHLTHWPRDGYFAPPEGLFPMLGNRHPIMTGMLFRREIRDAFGVFDKDLIAADVDLELRVAARFPIVISKAPCAVYTMHPTSLSSSSQVYMLSTDWPRIVAKLAAEDSISPADRDRAVNALVAQLSQDSYRIGVKSVVARTFADARALAAALRDHYGRPREARRLQRLERICRLFPPAGWGLTLTYKLLHLRHARSDHSLQRDYGKYAKYLTTV